ncbi:hypothetical protein ACP70R_010004 [Stipagrostis hirtigluma subsp. patula]
MKRLLDLVFIQVLLFLAIHLVLHMLLEMLAMSSSSTKTFRLGADQETDAEEETNPKLYQHFASLVSSLPSSNGMAHVPLYRHDHGWHSNPMSIVGCMVADACFAARASDIVVATYPKCGTTWTKSLVYATVRRGEHPVDSADHPFNSCSPHDCIKYLEEQLFTQDRIPDLDKLPDPRLFATHVPFVSLPRTVITSGSKIVYVCRDAKDTLISQWAFVNKLRVRDGLEPLPVEAAVDMFCDGLSPFGPYWDHVLGYWHAHLACPENVLFFRYEEMQRDPAAHVRRMAEFAGCPFGAGEEEDAVVDAIVKVCSFEHMSKLEVSMGGTVETVNGTVLNSSLFRRGVVGDWANHLSSETARRIDAITEAKFRGSGLDM